VSGYRLPAPQGAWIDRDRPLRFRFNGEEVPAFVGDTVASAVLAHGIRHVGRSFKLHRPRGIVAAGVEEPCALVDAGTGARRTPNTRMTDIEVREGLMVETGNAWPGLRLDLMSAMGLFSPLLPAGFYYKTFRWPHWRWYEPLIRRMAGLGHAAGAADPDRYDESSARMAVLVVGAGEAGLLAAVTHAESGHDTWLIESAPAPGGWYAATGPERIAGLVARAERAGVRLMPRTTAVGIYDHQLVVAVESLEFADARHRTRERLWKFRPARIVLATGAFERPMLFPGNDRPGVMLAGAIERYAALYGVGCGRRVVVATACDSAYAVVARLKARGIDVAAIVDRRRESDIAAPPPPGIDVLAGSAIVAVHGRRGIRAVTIASGSARVRIAADLVASAGGFTPNVGLYSQAGGKLAWQEKTSMFVPAVQLPGMDIVGAASGQIGEPGRVPADTRPAPGWIRGRADKIFVDLQNDVTADDIALAARENYRSVEHLKRYTTVGMATDQGKTSNVNALVLLGEASGRTPPQVGTTRFRPPYRPVTLGALAGGRKGRRFRPLRLLRARAFHLEHGACFEEFGGWERPAGYPMEGETLQEAAEREAAHVRRSVGLFDASPIGKLEIFGADAAEFLDRMYVGTLSTLAVGAARYGVLANENGTIIDDGIVSRIGKERFWVNTTSGGIERIHRHFEEWLQCEHTDLRVVILPATEQWGNVTVSGPKAWQLLERIGIDGVLSPAGMPHMTFRESEWKGAPLRVLRASFCGELGYEINIPSSKTEILLRSLWMAGKGLDPCVYGIEALMVMRTEKGYLHIGSETDGTTLPQDVGLARGIKRKAIDFVGRRSMLRPAARDADRLQLVGLVSVDGASRIPVGAHLGPVSPPAQSHGYVTSSCYSPALSRPIALAMVRGGSSRTRETLRAWHLGQSVGVEIVELPFYDPKGDRLNG